VPAEIPETAARTKAERKARARAKKSRDTALRALDIDDAVAAEKSLRRCVATFDGPACRLHLGLLHARAGELEEAAIHFERYLEQWPDAPGADQLRAALTALPDVE
jgi:tetratricopeptide (TPR) repeat protein